MAVLRNVCVTLVPFYKCRVYMVVLLYPCNVKMVVIAQLLSCFSGYIDGGLTNNRTEK